VTWIESHLSLSRHPKTTQLCRTLGLPVPHAVGHLTLLWHWTLEQEPDGDLSRVAVEDLAAAAHWPGDPAAWRDALVGAGFLDPDGRVHNWRRYVPDSTLPNPRVVRLAANARALMDRWESVTQAPESVTHSVTQTPVSVTQRPESITQTPVSVTQEPGSITQRSASVTQTATGLSTPVPAGSDRGTGSRNSPVSGTPVPPKGVPEVTSIPAPVEAAAGVGGVGGEVQKPLDLAVSVEKLTRAAHARAATLDSIRAAFAAAGVRGPTLRAADEQAAALRLLTLAGGPTDFVAYWRDIRSGAYGDAWLRTHLNFVSAERQDRFVNWQAWKAGEVTVDADTGSNHHAGRVVPGHDPRRPGRGSPPAPPVEFDKYDRHIIRASPGG
jgi:hypothetical protein